jgi:hypothetical protein
MKIPRRMSQVPKLRQITRQHVVRLISVNTVNFIQYSRRSIHHHRPCSFSVHVPTARRRTKASDARNTTQYTFMLRAFHVCHTMRDRSTHLPCRMTPKQVTQEEGLRFPFGVGRLHPTTQQKPSTNGHNRKEQVYRCVPPLPAAPASA